MDQKTLTSKIRISNHKKNLTSQQLMRFAGQIADGMSYLTTKSVSQLKKTNNHKVYL